MLIPFEFQDRAAAEVCAEVRRKLSWPGANTITVKGPTGCGKTVIFAEILRRLREESMVGFFIAPLSLHSQALPMISMQLDDPGGRFCLSPEQLTGSELEKGQVLFINWSSVNRGNNLIMRPNESGISIPDIVMHARRNGHKIFCFVDEPQHTRMGQRSRSVIDLIRPDITVEASATPEQEPSVLIRIEDVIEAQLVRVALEVNPGLGDVDELSAMTNEYIIDQALVKQQELKELAKKCSGDEAGVYNPLIIICVQRAGKYGDDNALNDVEAHLARRGLTRERRLAFGLAEDKENFDRIAEIHSPVDALIFKDGLAVGWNCPRAQMLVMLRNIVQDTPTIQILGRVLRTVGCRHYTESVFPSDDGLDKAYMFTNVRHVAEAQTEYADKYVHPLKRTGRRREDIYSKLNFPNIHIRRARELVELRGSRFGEIFSGQFAQATIDRQNNTTIHESVVHGTLRTVDEGASGLGSIGYDSRDPRDIQYYYQTFLIECLREAQVTSKNDLSEVKNKIAKELGGHSPANQMIVLNNKTAFKDIIKSSVEQYRDEIQAAEQVVNRSGEKIIVIENGRKRPTQQVMPFWEVPEEITYPEQEVDTHWSCCLYDKIFKIFPGDRSQHYNNEQEYNFRLFLDEWNAVKYWYQQPDKRESKHFAVAYLDTAKRPPRMRGFYPDWVILFQDGRVGIFDTKREKSALPVEKKALILQKELRSWNRNGLPPVFGGIVTFHRGDWWLNDSSSDPFNWDIEGSKEGWRLLRQAVTSDR